MDSARSTSTLAALARAQQVGIGAILMRDIAKLAELAATMRDAISVKYRLAVDDQDLETTLDA